MVSLPGYAPSRKDLTVDQVSAKLQVHPQTVKRWIRNGELPAYRWGKGGRFMVRETDLNHYLRGRWVTTK